MLGTTQLRSFDGLAVNLGWCFWERRASRIHSLVLEILPDLGDLGDLVEGLLMVLGGASLRVS